MKKQFTFIESMIKVGVIGFGGGNALIPVLEQEVVNEKKLVSKDEYDKSVIAATLTPGALPVEIASGIGLHVGGIGGMLAGGVLMALPGVVFTVLYLMLCLAVRILIFYSRFSMLPSALQRLFCAF